MSKFKKVVSSFSFNIISSVTVLLVVFSLIISSIGYISFTNTLKREYKITTYHMAKTAAALIDADKIDFYLDGEATDSYNTSYINLKQFCNYMDVTIVHCYKLDESNCLDAVNVFNVINDKDLKVNGGSYEEWELGYEFGEDITKNFEKLSKKLFEGKVEYGEVYRTKNLNGKDPHINTLIPVRNSENKIVAMLSVQRPMSELANGRRPYMITIAISTIITLIVAAAIAGIYIRLQFVKPIRNIMDESKSFAKDNKKGALSETKKSRILEIKELSKSIDQLEDDMIKYIESLTKATTEQKRMSVELNIAKEIQEASVPNVFPAFPDRTDFDLFASMHPAKAVGGDFYNFALIDDNHLVTIMADVSGKGVPAALFMMVSNILLTERLKLNDSPADALTFLNNRICNRNILNMFVTVWVGIIELDSGKVVACNAGHDDPVILRKNGRTELYKEKHGIIVGAMSEAVYENYEFNLEKGDKLFLYTDGVTEATNTKNELFKAERMLETLSKNRTKSPKEIIKSVKKSVDEFVGSAPQFDDITMLCVELKNN